MTSCSDTSTIKAVFRMFAMYCQSLINADIPYDIVYRQAGETLKHYYNGDMLKTLQRLQRETDLLATHDVTGTTQPPNIAALPFTIGLQLIEDE